MKGRGWAITKQGWSHVYPFLSYSEKNSSLVGLNFGLCIYVSMYVCMYVSFLCIGLCHTNQIEVRGGRKGLKGFRWCGFALFLVRFCGNFYFNLRYFGFTTPRALRFQERLGHGCRWPWGICGVKISLGSSCTLLLSILKVFRLSASATACMHSQGTLLHKQALRFIMAALVVLVAFRSLY